MTSLKWCRLFKARYSQWTQYCHYGVDFSQMYQLWSWCFLGLCVTFRFSNVLCLCQLSFQVSILGCGEGRLANEPWAEWCWPNSGPPDFKMTHASNSIVLNVLPFDVSGLYVSVPRDLCPFSLTVFHIWWEKPCGELGMSPISFLCFAI